MCGKESDFWKFSNTFRWTGSKVCAGTRDYGYTANVPLADLMREDVLFAYKNNGEDITPDHGWPLRFIVPHLYAWKSVKWVRALEFLSSDSPGFWEQNGYHIYGDPFKEQRFWDD